MKIQLFTSGFLLLCFVGFMINCKEDSTSPPLPTPSPEPDFMTVLTEDMDIDRYIGIQYSSSESTGDPEWTVYHYDTDDCKCILGDPFKISIRDSGSSNIILHMQGGGACWPGMDFFCSTTASTGSNGNIMSKSSLNPCHDWNVVFIPYCDGSVHSGDNNADYNEDGTVDHYHWGIRHVSAAVTLMKELFPNTEKILVTGSSAGGYGTHLAYAVVKSQFPDQEIMIFNDAGPGLFNPKRQDEFEKIKETWGIEQFFPSYCELCDEQFFYIYDYYLARVPDLRIGLYSSYGDLTIGGVFLNLAADDYKELLLQTSDFIHNNHPDRFNRFFVEGRSHTTYEVGLTYEVEGTSIYEWIGQMINEDDSWSDKME